MFANNDNLYIKKDQEYNFPINIYNRTLQDKIICLDPGHGGKDRYNKGYSGLYVEADGVLDIALKLRHALLDTGAKIILTRDKDMTLSLAERCHIAEKAQADIFISIHTDACGDPAVRGATAFYSLNPLKESKKLAHSIIEEYTLITGEPNRGARFRWNSRKTNDYYGVLRGTSMPAVIMECGFHTNSLDEARLLMPEYRLIVAHGLKLGIMRYFRK